MPQKALVALGTALGLGLLALPVPAWCSDAKTAEPAISRSVDTVPIISGKSIVPSPALTLDDALMRALKDSPKLAAFSQEVKARTFEAYQAGFRPNPEFSVEVENLAGSGDFSGTDNAETTVRISQLLELGGKRARRQEVGRMEREMAEREYEIARAEVFAQTRDRFVAVLAAQKRLSLAEEQVGLSQKVLQTVGERVAAGETAAIERVRFQTLVAEAILRRDRARQELAAVRLVLAGEWGSKAADFHTVQGDLEGDHTLPDWPDLVSRLDRSPALALWESELRRADRTLALERVNRVPDITLSLGARNDRGSGDNAVVAEIAFPLPVFDRNQGGVGAARARRAKAENAARAAQLQVHAALAEVWQKLHSAHGEVVMLRDEILPASVKIFDAVTYGYQAGKFGFLEVLDAERTLFEAKSRYVDALRAYHQAFAELERLLGQTFTAEGNPTVYNENERGQS